MADAVGVHIGLVRQVHQIVDDKAIVAFEAIERAALAFPFVAVVPVEVRQRGGVRQSGIAGPDPDEAMALGDRIGAHAGRRIDCLLRRHEGAPAGGIEDQPVIAAHNLIAGKTSHRQRQQPMPAGVLERRDSTVGAAIEHDVFVADRSGGERALNFVAPGRGIPGVQGKGSCRSPWRCSRACAAPAASARILDLGRGLRKRRGPRDDPRGEGGERHAVTLGNCRTPARRHVSGAPARCMPSVMRSRWAR